MKGMKNLKKIKLKIYHKLKNYQWKYIYINIYNYNMD